MAVSIPNKLYFKIGEVSRITGIESYILRYWSLNSNQSGPIEQKLISGFTGKKMWNQF